MTVEILGDMWSFLVIRDLMLKGMRSFSEFKKSEERIATNILSDRLSRLADEGIIVKRRLASDRRKFVYHLSEKGIDLAPILVEMIIWGARYEQTDAPPAEIREMESRRDAYLSRIRRAWERAVARSE